MQYWLLKTEPEEWSWKNQIKCNKKSSVWDGVRNFQARNNLKAMNADDLCFFYHTGKEKKIIGIVKVIKEYFPDKNDTTQNFGSIMVRSHKKFKLPVSLKDIKKHRFLRHLPLIKQSRLSVMSIDSKSWKIICKMGKINS
jgi:predicted RNA-binding protein with PUA-like domain